MPKASVRAIFDKVDLDKSGQLDIDEFMDFVKLLRERYYSVLRSFLTFLLLFLIIVSAIYKILQLIRFLLFFYHCYCKIIVIIH